MNSAHAALGSLAPASAEDTLPSPLDVLKYAHGKAHVRDSVIALFPRVHSGERGSVLNRCRFRC